MLSPRFSMRSPASLPYHIEAEKYRAEAAQLREELAQIENQSTASVAAP